MTVYGRRCDRMLHDGCRRYAVESQSVLIQIPAAADKPACAVRPLVWTSVSANADVPFSSYSAFYVETGEF